MTAPQYRDAGLLSSSPAPSGRAYVRVFTPLAGAAAHSGGRACRRHLEPRCKRRLREAAGAPRGPVRRRRGRAPSPVQRRPAWAARAGRRAHTQRWVRPSRCCSCTRWRRACEASAEGATARACRPRRCSASCATWSRSPPTGPRRQRRQRASSSRAPRCPISPLYLRISP
jgi:hypothetical protein